MGTARARLHGGRGTTFWCGHKNSPAKTTPSARSRKHRGVSTPSGAKVHHGGSSSAALTFPSALMNALARPTSHLHSHNLAKAFPPKTSPFGEARAARSDLLPLFQAPVF